jgi:hypothetical protein
LLIRRADLNAATAALQQAGFTPAKVFGVTAFLDGPEAKPSESIRLLFAGEKMQENYALANPDVSESVRPTTYPVMALEPLVRMKLTSYRRKDQVHIQDLINVGLIDATWLSRFPEPLAARLRELLDDPRG